MYFYNVSYSHHSLNCQKDAHRVKWDEWTGNFHESRGTHKNIPNATGRVTKSVVGKKERQMMCPVCGFRPFR